MHPVQLIIFPYEGICYDMARPIPPTCGAHVVGPIGQCNKSDISPLHRESPPPPPLSSSVRWRVRSRVRFDMVFNCTIINARGVTEIIISTA